jgi:hypothetical protein
MMKCPFGCSHHTLPTHFNFCPYCRSKLENDSNTIGVRNKNVSKYENLVNKQRNKKDVSEPFPELVALSKGDEKCRP